MKRTGHFRTILSRELVSYFNSPIAYIFTVVFVVLTCGMYMTHFFLIRNADMRSFFALLPVILSVFLPAVTMRLWAEERRGNTFELLLTFPMKTSQLVIGKYIASLLFYIFALSGTLLVPIMLFMIGKPDIGPMIGGYIGSIFVGAFFLAVGIFVSGMCKDQIVAFIVASIACFFFYLSGLDYMASLIDGWLPGIGTFIKDNFGMTEHLSGFQKGVIDIKDVLYFLIMSGVFLILNVLSLEDRMRPKAKILFSGAIGVCLCIGMIANVLISDISLGRFDLTEDKLYTVTDAAKSILKSLRSPVTVKFYVSPREKMPTALKTLERDVEDKLEELKVVSGGNLEYKIFHMEPTNLKKPDAEDAVEESLENKLQAKGITPFQVKSIEEDEIGIKLIYSSIAIAYKERPEEIIPRVAPQTLNSLEYDLISNIYRMTLDKKPKVALIAPYEEKTMDPQMAAIMRQMGQSAPSQYIKDDFNVLEAALKYDDYDFARIRLTKDEPIPEDTDTLIIVSPKTFSERQRYEISRFLAGGGSVILAAQGYVYDYNSTGGSGMIIVPQQIDTGVNELLKEYGIEISDKLLMDPKNQQVVSISGAARMGPFAVSVPVKIPIHILIDQDMMNQDTSITGRLSALFYLWGAPLDLDEEKLKENQLEHTVLFTSSKESWLVPYQQRPLTPTDLEAGSHEQKPNIPLAVLVKGQFPDLFSGKDVPAWQTGQEASGDESIEPEEEEDHEPVELKPGELIVVGCSKMFEESFVQGGGILNFFRNCVDALTLGGDLINIRTHQAINRSIQKIRKMSKLWYRFMTVLLVPLVLVAVGFLRFMKRKKDKKSYLAALAEIE